jgi:hypothetical protein
MDELKTPNQPNTEQTQAIAGKNTFGHNWYPILTPQKQKAICCDERSRYPKDAHDSDRSHGRTSKKYDGCCGSTYFFSGEAPK